MTKKFYTSLEFKCTSIRKVKKAYKYQKRAGVFRSKSMRWLANVAKETKYVCRHCHDYAEYLKCYHRP